MAKGMERSFRSDSSWSATDAQSGLRLRFAFQSRPCFLPGRRRSGFRGERRLRRRIRQAAEGPGVARRLARPRLKGVHELEVHEVLGISIRAAPAKATGDQGLDQALI